MSTSIETLDFNNNDNMVNLEVPVTDKVQRDNTYETNRENLANNNMPNDKEDMMSEFATPLSEVMPSENMMMAPDQQQMMQAPSGSIAPPMMAPQQPQQQQQAGVAKAANFGNLTDDQLDALIVGVAAMLAFSPQVKERLVTAVPSLFTEAGNRTLAGNLSTGLVAGIVFYIVKKFVIKN